MPRLTRRKLLWVGGAGLAAGAVGGLWAVRPRRRRIEDRTPGRAERFEPGLRVVVVGGGLAGMSAALELAERGAQVTLVEAASHLGGKLGGWPIDVGEESYPMEHGFHGFFAQYYNLDDVIRRLGLEGELVLAESYPMLFREGETETFEPGGSGFPFNLGGFYLGSKNLELSSMMTDSPQMRALLEFDPERTYAEYDEVSFHDFCQGGVDPKLYEFFFAPFAKTTLNDPRRTSAAHVLQFFHFYYLGNPEGLGFRYTRDDSMKSLILPWQSHLERLGVEVVTGAEVKALRYEGERIAAVELGDKASSQPLVASLDAESVPAGRPTEIGRDAWDVPLYGVRRGGELIAMRGRCTHQGCPLDAVESGFSCPCHGGRFDLEGRPTAGPPDRPLERLEVRGGQVFARPGEREVLSADAVVLATDVRGTRRIVAGSGLPEPFAARVAALGEADPYVVVRLWFDRIVPGEGAAFFTTGQYELLDSIGIYDRLQRPSMEWAARNEGAVVELHAYAVRPELDRGPQGNRDRLVEEFLDCMPAYAEAEIVHEEVMQQDNFSGFAPGSHANRPGTKTDIPNLFFAGDWVRTELPVALMEAAVTSGRLAANEIMESHGVRRAPVDTVDLRGPLS